MVNESKILKQLQNDNNNINDLRHFASWHKVSVSERVSVEDDAIKFLLSISTFDYSLRAAISCVFRKLLKLIFSELYLPVVLLCVEIRLKLTLKIWNVQK